MISKSVFSVAHGLRLSALAEIQLTLSRIEQNDTHVRQQLVEAAPESIRPLLEDERVISNLLQFGRSIWKMPYRKNPYGLTNSRKVKAAFGYLMKAWGDSITINVRTDDPRQIEISIHIVR